MNHDTSLFSVCDNHLIEHMCQFMDEQTIAQFALTNKRIKQVCKSVLDKIDLQFVEYHMIDEINESTYTSVSLPPSSTPLNKLIAHINGMTKMNIFITSYFGQMCCVSGYYRKKWFRLSNDLSNKRFTIHGQIGLHFQSLRTKLIDKINDAIPKSFCITIHRYRQRQLKFDCI